MSRPDRDAATVPLAPETIDRAVAAGDQLSPGVVLGERYEITAFIARGGMGAVYAARDRELDIEVALKTLRADIAWSATTIERFKREIQLAREIANPGVCRVFDLGRHRELVFLTMERLRGPTLAQHLAETGAMSTADALPLVTQLAEALGAAHVAGVIHRDLKPSNVILVERHGSPRAVITDFGIARGASEAGEAAGTPDYVAPEQIAGEAAGPTADVFSLGVVMQETITGTVSRAPLDALATLDRRWAAAIRRCLDPDPARRFHATRDVIAALAPPRRRWPYALAGLALVAIAAGSVVMASGPGRDECAADDAALAGTWDDQRRAALARSFAPHHDAWTRVEAAFDHHAARWRQRQEETCRDRDRIAPDELAARRRCLARGLVAMRVLAGELSRPLDATTARSAVRLAEELPDFESCDDASSRMSESPELDRLASEVAVLIGLARYGDAVTAAEALEGATASDERRHVVALYLLGRARLELGDVTAAEPPLRSAIALGARLADDATLARCWVALINLLVQRGRLQEAATIAGVAEAAVVRAGSDPRLVLELGSNVAVVESWGDDYGRAVSRLETGLAAAEKTFGPSDPEVLLVQLRYAEILVEVGRPVDALATAERAADRARAAFGADDFRVALAGYVRGMALRDLGRLDEARGPLEKALAVANTLASDHPGRFHVQTELGKLHLVARDLDAARGMLEAALASALSLPGPDLLRIGMALGNVGELRFAAGDLAGAEAAWREALDVRTRGRGPESASVGIASSALGAIATARGDRAEARARLETAVRLLARLEVKVYPALARARLARVVDDPDRARALLEEARPHLAAPPGELPVDLEALRALP